MNYQDQILLAADFLMTAVLHCTGSFIITLPSSQCDSNNVEMNYKNPLLGPCRIRKSQWMESFSPTFKWIVPKIS